MDTLIKIPGTGLVRDITNMALINSDANALEDYKMKRKMLQTQKIEINNIKSKLSEIDTIKSDLNGVKSDLKEIKDLMSKLLSK